MTIEKPCLVRGRLIEVCCFIWHVDSDIPAMKMHDTIY